MSVYGNILYCRVYICECMGTVSVSVTTGTEMEKERKKERRAKVGQTAATQALNSILPSFSSLFCHRGEAKEVTHSYEHSINLRRWPCSSWIQCPLPLFVCLLSCHLSAAGARLHCQEHRGGVPPDAHFSARAAVANISTADGSVLRQRIVLREVFDRDHDKTCPG